MDNCKPLTEIEIRTAALLHSIPPKYMITMANIESTCNPYARNASGATGLFQFLPNTALEVGLQPADRTDSLKASMAAAVYTNRNLSALRRQGISVDLNRNPEYGYLAHQQGASGLAQIINAANNGNEVSHRIRKHMNANGGTGKTPKEFLEYWKKRYDQMANGEQHHTKAHHHKHHNDRHSNATVRLRLG